MPKQNKKSDVKGKDKGTKVKAVLSEADDDFDDMLAKLRAADVTAEGATSSSRSASSSNSNSSSTPAPSSSTTNQAAAATPDEVLEEALLRACVRGDISQLRRWAKQSICVTSAEPLCTAVRNGKYEVAQCLVRELGADVNQADAKARTPLLIATHLGSLRMVKWLAIEVGADVNKAGGNGFTPVFAAAGMGHLALVRCLVKELGADINQADIKGCSPLFFAAQEGGLEVVKCMVVELGAEVNQANEDGFTPLMVAANNKHHEVVRYLLKHGANPQASHSRYGTAANISKILGAPAEETTYLEARTHCANPDCTNAGLKKCERCLQAYFSGNACIRVHWPAHKAECKVAAAKLKAATGASSSSSSMSSSS
jgi:ankyrin repeat protein